MSYDTNFSHPEYLIKCSYFNNNNNKLQFVRQAFFLSPIEGNNQGFVPFIFTNDQFKKIHKKTF